MAIKSLVSSAWEEIDDLQVPVDSAYEQADHANALVDSAWQEVWGSGGDYVFNTSSTSSGVTGSADGTVNISYSLTGQNTGSSTVVVYAGGMGFNIIGTFKAGTSYTLTFNSSTTGTSLSVSLGGNSYSGSLSSSVSVAITPAEDTKNLSISFLTYANSGGTVKFTLTNVKINGDIVKWS